MSQGSRTVAIAQARMGSTRVPGKVMRNLCGYPVLRWTINALRMVHGIDTIVVATSTLEADDVIEAYCKEHRIECFRGSETDVLDRFYQCAKHYNADIVLRLTCDCPFLDPVVVGEVIRLRSASNADYASNTEPPTYPDGLDTECFTFTALESAWRESTRHSDRDCVTRFIIRNRDRFPAVNLTCPIPKLNQERWVLDTEADWNFCVALAQQLMLVPDDKIRAFEGSTYLGVLDALDRKPEIRQLNEGAVRNERFYDALADEQLPKRTFTRSQGLFERAIQVIPFGAQTFSKSHLQFPQQGRSPLYVSHGDGAYVYDVDGNDYVDLVSALLPVVLGYRDPDVDRAIRNQIDAGISFSLATRLEAELAETLCRLIPCAEMVKFGKTGTDVTTAAVRLARAYTGRDHILLSGYHGWADWSMSATDRNNGIPEDVRNLTHRFDFSKDPETFRGFTSPEKIAAIIVEPNDSPEFLGKLQHYCYRHGIVLIFDEIITGFRYDLGGAQKLYGVTPDLATFGKSMANGMPISALVGRRDIMKRMEPPNNIFYSGTFFGETLSIAAAIATIKKMEAENVIDHLLKTGARLEFDILKLIRHHDLIHLIGVTGYYPLLKLNFTSDKVRSLFMRHMIQNGVLIIASNNLSFSHKGPQLKRIIKAYDATFAAIVEAIRDGSINEVETVAAAPLRATA